MSRYRLQPWVSVRHTTSADARRRFVTGVLLASALATWSFAPGVPADSSSGSTPLTSSPCAGLTGDEAKRCQRLQAQANALAEALIREKQTSVLLRTEGAQHEVSERPSTGSTSLTTGALGTSQHRHAAELAEQFARQKARERVEQSREAQRQIQLARERQLKELYHRGLALYQQGRYAEAILVLQQMALVDPSHALVKSADRLITRAELKRYEEQARAVARAPVVKPEGGAVVSQLEQLLVEKRIELETAMKYAKAAMHERQYDTATKLLTKILVQDPSDRDAQRLMEQVEEAKLTEEKDRLERRIVMDERQMIHDVIKAQVVPEAKTVGFVPPPSPYGTSEQFSAKLQQPISLDFSEVALGDVVDFVADGAGISIIPSPQLDLKNQLVSIKVKDLPLEQAIKYLAKSLSLSYRIEQDAVLLATKEEFENQAMETRVFFLRSGFSPATLEVSAVEQGSLIQMESIKDLITQTIPQPPDSKLVVDDRLGALIATNTGDNLQLTERLLSQLDVTPVQVLIEARVMELTVTDLEHLGLETVLTDGYDLTKRTDTRPNQATPAGRTSGHQIASGGGFKFPALSREDEGVNLTLQGVMTAANFETVLHLLEETKKSKTLSAPRVTTLNNKAATIKVVDEFRYPTRYEVSLVQFDTNGDGDFDDAGETEFVNVPQDIQKRDVGILLNVTPSVGRDLKMMTLVLAPEVSSFSQFRDLGGGVTVPEFTSSQVTTSVVINDGETVVLGGLMKDTVSSTLTKVPFFGDLPLLGPLFRQQNETVTRKNLIIFITARIIGPRGSVT
ncbi:MAG: hypothetical protein HY595_02695 [Candidatus Omnitrophica bacterium]|nr:hypothetical protein [Candidatus Omnitrophota bacterium]